MYIFSSLSVRGCHIGYLMNLTEYFHIEDMTQIIYIRDNEIMNNDQKLLHFDFDSMDIEVKGKKIIAKSEVMDIYKLKDCNDKRLFKDCVILAAMEFLGFDYYGCNNNLHI